MIKALVNHEMYQRQLKLIEKKPYRPENLTLIFSGGGTGGHIYPAIAVADRIKELVPDVKVLFVGARGKMEMTMVPQHGYEIIGLWISGLQRKLTLSNLLFPFKVIHSYLKSKAILRKNKPDVVTGFGGYASSPIMLAATRNGIKTVVQEQNSYAGIANKAVAGKADRFCVAYENMDRFFPTSKISLTGNPVRSDIANLGTDKTESLKHFGLDPSMEVILVIGGSLGARTINESLIQNIQFWGDSGKQVLWQTGKLYNKEMMERLPKDILNIHLFEFIEQMDLAYIAADIVISRAGALSISELCLVKKPVIFVPSPNVAEDHQTKNAMALVEKNAAIIVEDRFAIKELASTALKLLADNDKMVQLSANITRLGKPNATDEIANQILELARKI